MAFTVNTNEVAEGDRAEWVHDVFASRIVPVELSWPRHRRASAYGSITPLGDLVVCLGATSALKIERTPSLARDAMEPCSDSRVCSSIIDAILIALPSTVESNWKSIAHTTFGASASIGGIEDTPARLRGLCTRTCRPSSRRSRWTFYL